MAWVVDTSVVLDLVVTNSPARNASAACLQQHLADGLCVCPVTFIELGPAFGGDPRAAEIFLHALPIATTEPWTAADTEVAHRLWHEHQARRRASQAVKRPVADVLIAAFASRFQGIITRNASDFRGIAPALKVIVP